MEVLFVVNRALAVLRYGLSTVIRTYSLVDSMNGGKEIVEGKGKGLVRLLS